MRLLLFGLRDHCNRNTTKEVSDHSETFTSYPYIDKLLVEKEIITKKDLLLVSILPSAPL